MPTTVRPALHAATIQEPSAGVRDAESLLQQISYEASTDFKGLVQSTFSNMEDRPPVFPNVHGFVKTAVQAYSQHLHLIIRPEDIWFAILTQLNIYVNEHAEELRGSFVSHQGQKELEIEDWGSFKAYDFGLMARRMASLIEENLVDPTIRKWVQPSFTTTTEEDVTVSSIIMMGVLKKYFSYKFRVLCGLPSVTLLGEKKDWEEILERLERIKDLGDEPAKWYNLLVPVMTNFIHSFDRPDDTEVKDFWQKIAHYSGGGSGPTYLSGWITAFCFWSEHGRCMYRKEGHNNSLDSTSMSDYSDNRTPRLFLSGVPYHRIDSDDIPPGYVSVPVKVDDDGDEYNAMMLAGSVGMSMTSSGEPGAAPRRSPFRLHDSDVTEGHTEDAEAPLIGPDTVQPVTGWFMFELKQDGDTRQENGINEMPDSDDGFSERSLVEDT